MPTSQTTPISSAEEQKWSGWKIAIISTVLILVVTALFVVDKDELVEYGQRLPGALFLALFIILPLVGFPLSIFLIIVGLKYGIFWGMVVATVGTCLHNLIAYAATKSWFLQRIEKVLKNRGYSIPDIPRHHQWWATALYAGIPGVPYAIKLYSLALTNVPFAVYFWIGWPIYAASCIVYVGLGEAVASLSIGWFFLVALIMLLLLWGTGKLISKYTSRSGSPNME